MTDRVKRPTLEETRKITAEVVRASNARTKTKFAAALSTVSKEALKALLSQYHDGHKWHQAVLDELKSRA